MGVNVRGSDPRGTDAQTDGNGACASGTTTGRRASASQPEDPADRTQFERLRGDCARVEHLLTDLCVRIPSSLEESLKFEQLLADLCARLSAVGEDDLEGELEVWMRRLSEILGADRSSFAELRPEGLVVTHAYAVPGINPHPKGLANNALPWLTGELEAGRTVVLNRIPDDLPDEAAAERRYFTAVGMRSGIGVPVSVGGPIVCALTFGRFREAREWTRDVVARVQIAAGAFGNAIARTRAKQRLDRQQAELAHIGRVAAMGELASVIAHELDQPLTAVVSNAEAARNFLRMSPPDPDGVDDALVDVIDAAMRISEIIRRERRLLKKSAAAFEAVDVNEVVHEIELFVRAEARRDGARVAFQLQPGLPPVRGDKVQLQQVFLNLARNALHAMRERPREARALEVRTVSSTTEVTLSVTDSGPAVDDAVLARMFEPFFTTKADGLGMGLSISRSIVEAHRGRTWADRNAVGTGLTVHVAVPRK